MIDEHFGPPEGECHHCGEPEIEFGEDCPECGTYVPTIAEDRVDAEEQAAADRAADRDQADARWEGYGL